MTAEILRQAAALIRERATVADEICGELPWSEAGLSWNDNRGTVYMVGAGPANVADAIAEEVAHHIASWHPAVALAVADWLDEEAGIVEMDGGRPVLMSSRALAVARAYLGGDQ